MKGFALLSAVAALGAVTATPTRTKSEPPSKRASLPKVSASGTAFWADGKRFYIRGIDYKPGGNSKNLDPLADPDVCDRDIQHFKDLGLNTIRIYAVDNSKSHDHCMSALADAGIYVIADVNSPEYAINRNSPKESYNTQYLQSVFATVEMMAKYDNLLAFFSGNEVINDATNTEAAPYVKAVTRDIKNFISSRGLRPIPVGYSAADVEENRVQMAMYLNCGSDDMRSDFFAFNDYSWCNSNFQESGWDQKVQTFKNYGLPIFLSEWGCNTNKNGYFQRKFQELGALMNTDEMTSVYSGGMLFEYSNEVNKKGIVEIDGTSVKELQPEYDSFKSALSKYPAPSGDGGAASTTHSVSCPASSAPNWKVDPSEVPAMPTAAEKFMKDGAGKGPGLDGGGSMDAGGSGESPSDVTTGTPSPTNTNPSTEDDSDNSVASLKAPMLVTGLALFFTICGTLLL